MDIQRVRALRDRIEMWIANANPRVLREFTLESYAGLVCRYPVTSSYKHVSNEVRIFSEVLLMNSNGHVLELYNKWLLTELMCRALDGGLGRMRLPEGVRELYHLTFERILKEIEFSENETGFYMHHEDKFLKELGVCSLRVIPAGAQKLSLCLLPLDFLFRKGPGQLFSGLSFLFFDLKGIKYYYGMHTDSHDPYLMSEFTAEGWRRYLMRCAEILKLNPEVKGIFGRSWFIDPKLEEISPKVCYVRRLVIESGGRMFSMGLAKESIQDAVHKSPTRKQLYQEGKYIPKEYMGIWSRKALITWADSQPHLDQRPTGTDGVPLA